MKDDEQAEVWKRRHNLINAYLKRVGDLRDELINDVGGDELVTDIGDDPDNIDPLLDALITIISDSYDELEDALFFNSAESMRDRLCAYKKDDVSFESFEPDTMRERSVMLGNYPEDMDVQRIKRVIRCPGLDRGDLVGEITGNPRVFDCDVFSKDGGETWRSYNLTSLSLDTDFSLDEMNRIVHTIYYGFGKEEPNDESG